MSLFRRFTSLLILITFSSINFIIPVRAAETSSSLSLQKGLPYDLNSVQIPEKFGKVQEFYKGKNPQTVILLQDAHAIPDAQRNIQKIISYFQQEYGVDFIGVEGAASKLDPQIFKSFPDQEAMKRLFNEYLEKGEVTGTTAAAIFKSNVGATRRLPAGQAGVVRTQYRGVEDWALYEKGLSLYQEAMEKEEEILEQLQVAGSRLQEEKKKEYSKKLLEVDGLIEEFYEDSKKFLEALKKLEKIKKLEARSELVLILGESKREEKELKEIEKEVKSIAERIKKNQKACLPDRQGSDPLNQNEQGGQTPLAFPIKVFNQKYQEFQTSRINAAEFALWMVENVGAGFKPAPTPRLRHVLKSQRRLQNIQGTSLFKEFETYAKSVKESLFRNDQERELDQRTRELRLLQQLAKLEMTRGEWEVVRRASLAHHGIRSAENHPEQGPERSRGAASKEDEIMDSLRSHFAFYENAELREQAMFRNLMKTMKRPHPNPLPQGEGRVRENAILVAGGFHTQGLTKLLKEKKVSYVLVTPNIDFVPEKKNYRDHMRGEVSWKNYYEIKNGKVDLYKAFVRGARDRLLNVGARLPRPGQRSMAEGEVSGGETPPLHYDALLLKHWRDQIIRDLAEAGGIERAGEYTSFLDEVAVKDLQQGSMPEWRLKLDKFIEGLRVLDSKGQLTEQNIINLFKPSTNADITYGNIVPGTLLRIDYLPGANVRVNRRAEARAMSDKKREYNKNGPLWPKAFQLETKALLQGFAGPFDQHSHQKSVYREVLREKFISVKDDHEKILILKAFLGELSFWHRQFRTRQPSQVTSRAPMSKFVRWLIDQPTAGEKIVRLIPLLKDKKLTLENGNEVALLDEMKEILAWLVEKFSNDGHWNPRPRRQEEAGEVDSLKPLLRLYRHIAEALASAPSRSEVRKGDKKDKFQNRISPRFTERVISRLKAKKKHQEAREFQELVQRVKGFIEYDPNLSKANYRLVNQKEFRRFKELVVAAGFPESIVSLKGMIWEAMLYQFFTSRAYSLSLRGRSTNAVYYRMHLLQKFADNFQIPLPKSMEDTGIIPFTHLLYVKFWLSRLLPDLDADFFGLSNFRNPPEDLISALEGSMNGIELDYFLSQLTESERKASSYGHNYKESNHKSPEQMRQAIIQSLGGIPEIQRDTPSPAQKRKLKAKAFPYVVLAPLTFELTKGGIQLSHQEIPIDENVELIDVYTEWKAHESFSELDILEMFKRVKAKVSEALLNAAENSKKAVIFYNFPPQRPDEKDLGRIVFEVIEEINGKGKLGSLQKVSVNLDSKDRSTLSSYVSEFLEGKLKLPKSGIQSLQPGDIVELRSPFGYYNRAVVLEVHRGQKAFIVLQTILWWADTTMGFLVSKRMYEGDFDSQRLSYTQKDLEGHRIHLMKEEPQKDYSINVGEKYRVIHGDQKYDTTIVGLAGGSYILFLNKPVMTQFGGYAGFMPKMEAIERVKNGEWKKIEKWSNRSEVRGEKAELGLFAHFIEQAEGAIRDRLERKDPVLRFKKGKRIKKTEPSDSDDETTRSKARSDEDDNVRSEIRKNSSLSEAATSLIGIFRNKVAVTAGLLTIIAQSILSTGVDPFVATLLAAEAQAVREEDIAAGRNAKTYLNTILAIREPKVIEYKISESDLARMGKNASGEIRNLMKAMHDASALNHNIMGRLSVPDRVISELRFVSHNKNDKVRLEKMGNTAVIYNHELKESVSYLAAPAAITVTGDLNSKRDILVSSAYSNGEEIYQNSQNNVVSPNIYTLALIVAAQPISESAAQGLIQIDNAGFRWIPSKATLDGMRFVIQLTEQYRSELRTQSAA